MRKRFANLFLLTTLIVYAVLVALVFLIFKEPVISRTTFILSVCFAIIPNLIMALIIFYKLRKLSDTDVITMPAVISAFITFNGIFFISSIITALINVLIVSVIVDIIILAIYVIVMMYYIQVMVTLSENDRIRKEKILFKRELTQQTEEYAMIAKDEVLIKKLKDLSSAFKYSDPMSHPSLAQDEAIIQSKVDALALLITQNVEMAVKSVEEIEILLKIRNNKCLRLK